MDKGENQNETETREQTMQEPVAVAAGVTMPTYISHQEQTHTFLLQLFNL